MVLWLPATRRYYTVRVAVTACHPVQPDGVIQFLFWRSGPHPARPVETLYTMLLPRPMAFSGQSSLGSSEDSRARSLRQPMRQRAADLEPSRRTPITWERNNLILSSPGTLGGRWVFVIGAYSTLLSTVEKF